MYFAFYWGKVTSYSPSQAQIHGVLTVPRAGFKCIHHPAKFDCGTLKYSMSRVLHELHCIAECRITVDTPTCVADGVPQLTSNSCHHHHQNTAWCILLFEPKKKLKELILCWAYLLLKISSICKSLSKQNSRQHLSFTRSPNSLGLLPQLCVTLTTCVTP